MPKTPTALKQLPQALQASLERLGADLAVARLRRKQSLSAWAARLGVSVPTLMRMESGDPGVGMGIYATALWLIGRDTALGELATPAQDRGALELDVREAVHLGKTRAQHSAQARLKRQPAPQASDD